MEHFSLIGVGLYSVPEARRLTKIPPATINRWVRGYARRRDGERIDYPALVAPGIPPIDDEVALNFRDLMELRFINRLRQLEISWSEIRLAVETARDLYNSPRPFGTKRFAVDGRKVFARLPQTGTMMRANHLFLGKMLEPSIVADIDYEGDEVARWWPEAGRRLIVIDPARSLGKPLVDEYGVPTSVLAASAFAEDSIDSVADWYEIPPNIVRAAVEFERSLQGA